MRADSVRKHGVWAVAVTLVVLFAAWWFFWPDSDLTHEFRDWAEQQPREDRYQDEGVRELTVDRAGDVRIYRMIYDGDPGYADARCDSAVFFARVRGEDGTKIVVEVHDPAGELLGRKDVGPEFCQLR